MHIVQLFSGPLYVTYFRRGPSAKLSGIAKCVFNAAIISSCNRRVQYGKQIVIVKPFSANTFKIMLINHYQYMYLQLDLGRNSKGNTCYYIILWNH